MYAVLLTAMLTPDVPAASYKAASGCVGTPAKAAAGCFGSTKAAPAASSCYGGSARSFPTPVRTALANAAEHRQQRIEARKSHGVTYYLPATAVYVPAATVYQSSAPPPARKTPVRNAASAVFCPGGRCPR